MCIMASQNGILIQSIADILHLLQDGYALAPGGRDLQGRPIITFPDRNVKADFTDEEFRQMLSYYTAVPPYGSPEDVARGFVIIVDRRSSNWGRVRPLISRILNHFPAPIQSLLIIAPTSFLQRMMADIKLSSIRSERLQKANMVLINAMNELQTYVCSNQLPQDLNGSHSYSHDKWIEHRMAVESLAIQEHRIARAIEDLSGHSAHRSLPRLVEDVQAMLEADSEEQARIHADLQRMLESAQTLANSITASFQSDLPPDRRIHLLAIERALSRLRDAQRRFEVFWSRQERHLCWGRRFAEFLEKADQAKQDLSQLSSNALALLPERSQTAVRSALEDLQRLQTSLSSFEERLEALKEEATSLEQSSAPSDSPEPPSSPAEAPAAVAERRSRCVEAREQLAALDAKMAAASERLEESEAVLSLLNATYEAMEKCSTWQANLAQLLGQKANSGDSTDARRAAVGELRAALSSRPALPSIEENADLFTEENQESLSNLRAAMNSAQEECERLVLKLDSGSARAGRVVRRDSEDPASKCVSASCLTDRDGTVEILTNGSSTPCDPKADSDRRLQKRSHVMRELIETERDYVDCLERIHKVFWSEIDSPSDPNLNVPKELKEDRRSLFGNWEDLLQFHKNNLLLELDSCSEQPAEMGRCFQDCQEKFELYSDYCLNKFYADALFARLGGDQDPFIRHCQERLNHALPLSAFLLKPVQRVQKYQLLLNEMLKNTPPGCEEASQLEVALNTMLRILRSLNDAMLRCDIVGYQKLSSKDLGRLLLHDNFQVCVENKNDRVVRSKLKERHVFLFAKSLLVCKSRLAGKNAEKVEYHFEMEMLLEECGFTESTKGNNPRRFEVWKDNRRVVLTMQAPTVEVKQCWTQRLQNLLLEQFKKLKEKVEMQREHGDRSSYQVLSSPSPTAKFSLLSTPSPTSPLVEKTLRSSASDDDVEVGGSRKGVDLPLSPGPYPVTQV